VHDASWEVDPQDVQVWIIGTKHFNRGSCDACTSYTTIFATPGDHDLVLTITNAHGITATTTYHVHVEDLIHATNTQARPASSPWDTGGVQDADAQANSFLHAFQRLVHFFAGY
jgi:hypothetical protein